jgi:hypothetical protein
MSRKSIILLTTALVIVLVLAVLAEPALAKGDPGEAGGNIGDLIRENFRPMVWATAGVLAVFAAFQRNFGMVGLLILVGTGIYGFFMDPSPYSTWGPDLLKTVFNLGTIGVR